MATTIKLKSGSGAPLAGDLVAAEPAFDLTNKRLYTEDSGGTVIEVGTNPSTIDINAGTIDGTVIGGSSAAAGTFTTFTSTGIDDNATSTAITIDASENVGIGTASPTDNLHVLKSGDSTLRVESSGTTTQSSVWTENDAGRINGVFVYGSLRSSYGAINSGEGAFYSNGPVNIMSDNPSGNIKFSTGGSGGSERMRIDSSGNLLVGTTNVDPVSGNVTGTSIKAQGNLQCSRDDGVVISGNRKSTDGVIFEARKDGTTVGSIGCQSGRLVIGSGDTGLRMAADLNNIVPWNTTTNLLSDSAIDLGGVTQRFKDFYLSNNISLSNASTSAFLQVSTNILQFGTSSSDPVAFYSNNAEAMRIDASGNLLVGRTSTAGSATDYGAQIYNTGIIYLFANATGNDDIFRGHNSAGTNTSAIEADGNYIDLSDERVKENITDAPDALSLIGNMQVRSFDWIGRDQHQTYGFVAQELKSTFEEAVRVPDDEEAMWGVRHSKIIPVLTKAIQEQQAMIETLQAQVAELQGA